MTSICTRCALRLRRAAERGNQHLTTTRAFSSTTGRKAGIPTFHESSNPELSEILASMRSEYFVPAWLNSAERKLIYKTKYKQLLEENPQTVEIGGEKIDLEWVDRAKDIPDRKKSVLKAIKLMARGEPREWNNLPALLTGLKKCKATPGKDQMEHIIRLANASGRFGILLQCLHQAHNTGMTMKRREVLNGMILGLHHTAQSNDWSKEGTEKAIREANEIALQLESEEHSSGRVLEPSDARRKPELLGLFLELASVHAWKFQDGKDADGKVRAYAERLLYNLDGAEQVCTSSSPCGFSCITDTLPRFRLPLR